MNACELCIIEPLNIMFEKYFDFAKTFSNETKYAERTPKTKVIIITKNNIIIELKI